MSDISFGELQEKLNFDNTLLRNTLDLLMDAKIVIEKKSKHKSLGFTYEINSMYHTCLCILIVGAFALQNNKAAAPEAAPEAAAE